MTELFIISEDSAALAGEEFLNFLENLAGRPEIIIMRPDVKSEGIVDFIMDEFRLSYYMRLAGIDPDDGGERPNPDVERTAQNIKRGLDEIVGSDKNAVALSLHRALPDGGRCIATTMTLDNVNNYGQLFSGFKKTDIDFALPGTAGDWQNLVLLHESDHCRTYDFAPKDEFMRDRFAYQYYYQAHAEGVIGDLAVPHAFRGLRSIATMMQGGNFDHANNYALNGLVPLPGEELSIFPKPEDAGPDWVPGAADWHDAKEAVLDARRQIMTDIGEPLLDAHEKLMSIDLLSYQDGNEFQLQDDVKQLIFDLRYASDNADLDPTIATRANDDAQRLFEAIYNGGSVTIHGSEYSFDGLTDEQKTKYRENIASSAEAAALREIREQPAILYETARRHNDTFEHPAANQFVDRFIDSIERYAPEPFGAEPRTEPPTLANPKTFEPMPTPVLAPD